MIKNIIAAFNDNPDLADFLWLYIIGKAILESPAIMNAEHEAILKHTIERIERRFA